MAETKREIKTDFSNDVAIDKYNLDVECAKQAGLVEKYGAELAQVKKELHLAKFKRDMTNAEVCLGIRNGDLPEKYASIKITEKSVLEIAGCDPTLGKLNKKVIKLQYEVNVLENALNAFEHRKRELDNLVKLHQTRYFESGGEGNSRLESSAEYQRAQLNHNRKRDLEDEVEDEDE